MYILFILDYLLLSCNCVLVIGTENTNSNNDKKRLNVLLVKCNKMLRWVLDINRCCIVLAVITFSWILTESLIPVLSSRPVEFHSFCKQWVSLAGVCYLLGNTENRKTHSRQITPKSKHRHLGWIILNGHNKHSHTQSYFCSPTWHKGNIWFLNKITFLCHWCFWLIRIHFSYK